MNFRDMTREDISYYNSIRKRDDGLDWVLKNLAITAGVIVIATIIWLLG
jgi:hypothetical protein